MTPLNPLFALIVILITFLTGYLINIKYKVRTSSKRFESIDGLRGFLAISVFIHHSTIWYKYLHTGNWAPPDSKFFTQLGQTGIALFFMISSFLFINKLIEFKGKNYDWKSFFIKRFFRLAPLHFFAVSIIIIIVFIESNWTLHTGYIAFTESIVKWFGFGIIGLDNINNVHTSAINAGVLWTLSYEWLLYFSLPLISIIILKSRPKIFYVILGLSFIIITLQYRSFVFEHILSFLGGAIAPLLLKYNKKEINFNNLWFSLILLISIISIFQFHSSSNYICKFLITLSFTLIALGNDFFGVLKSTTLKLLGSISYSTYLLHGIIIFVMINYVYGLEETKSLTQAQYCLLIFITSPFIILISFLTYRFIEKPFMKTVI
ncbi:MAG: acyltransferase [Crocinitomicaceae bacterium]|nr:acyltransferase [Crocinitomicaceae bacterium]